MTTTVVIDNGYAILQYHADKRLVHHTIHRFIPDRQLKELLNRGIDLLIEHRASKWLANDQQNSAVPQETAKWINEDWFPRAIAAGWKTWSIVLPEKAIGKLSLNQWIEPYTATGLNVRAFSSEADAMRWIEQQ